MLQVFQHPPNIHRRSDSTFSSLFSKALCSVVLSGAIVSFCSADSLATLSVPADVVPPHAVNPVITIAAVNTAHITFVFTWGKFHLLIFSFLLFH
jgi:hypothetical protein